MTYNNYVHANRSAGRISIASVLLLFIVIIYLSFFNFDLKKAYYYTVDTVTEYLNLK